MKVNNNDAIKKAIQYPRIREYESSYSFIGLATNMYSYYCYEYAIELMILLEDGCSLEKILYKLLNQYGTVYSEMSVVRLIAEYSSRGTEFYEYYFTYKSKDKKTEIDSGSRIVLNSARKKWLKYYLKEELGIDLDDDGVYVVGESLNDLLQYNEKVKVTHDINILYNLTEFTKFSNEICKKTNLRVISKKDTELIVDPIEKWFFVDKQVKIRIFIDYAYDYASLSYDGEYLISSKNGIVSKQKFLI